MKKIYFIVAFLLLFSVPVLAQNRIEKLVLVGPKSPVTHPMAYIIEAGLLNNVAKEVELNVWDNPDQLRALMAGGKAHFAAVPSYVAAMFYNKGVPVRLLNISTWGDLWIVSSDPEVKTLSELKGEEIVIPLRGDMPDLVFTSLALKQSFNPKKDFRLRYLPNFPTASQEVVSGRTKHAFLSEPLVSMAIFKSKGKEPRLYRAVNIQEEWGRAYNTKPRIARAGICALPGILKRPDVVRAFQNAYSEAVSWCKANPDKAGKVVAKHISGLKPRPVAFGIKNGMLEFVSARDAKPEIEHFFNVLRSLNPAKIGGKLPDDDFYWSEL